MKHFILAIAFFAAIPAFARQPVNTPLTAAEDILTFARDLNRLTRIADRQGIHPRELLNVLGLLEQATANYREAVNAKLGIAYTATIPVQGRTGYLIGTYDDFRGGVAGISISQSIDRICKMAGFRGARPGEVESVNFACATTPAPTVYCSNGNCSFAHGFTATGHGWCAATAVEWVACSDR